MSDELGGLSDHLPPGLERLAGDVLVGRYGDPHVAFVVFVYPERAPEVASITPGGSMARPLSAVQASKDAGGSPRPSRFFTLADLNEAASAMSAAHDMLRRPPRSVADGISKWGDVIVAEIAKRWQRHRDYTSERVMKAAAEEAKPRCPHCNGRFTVRGLPMHLARSAVCSKIEARRLAADGEHH